MEQVSYLGQPHCYRLSNATVEVVVTTDIGPRVIRYAFVGQDNTFGEVADAAFPNALGTWKPWGGHRLWAAPEHMPRTYAPDNEPVEHQIEGDRAIRVIQQTDASGIQKEMSVSLAEAGTEVTVAHRITNRLMWSIELAPWALTVVLGGVAVLPQEPFRPHGETFETARPLVLWPYSNLADPRWALGERFIRLRADADQPRPQKLGVGNKQGWCAYLRHRTLFIKSVAYDPGAQYPDDGSSFELFAAGLFMELETLGPLTSLQPGQTVEHVERWRLFADVDLGINEADMERAIRPLLREMSDTAPGK
jgi:hypothetical protein